MAEIRLTPAQQAAVENRGGALLVSAAAGSGKTKVLVDRLLSYVEDENDPANIDEFLIITYTKAAASELRGKISAELSRRFAENPLNRHLQRQLTRIHLAQISTVHAFCAAMLRRYCTLRDLPPDFRVAEQTEANAIRLEVFENTLEDFYRTREQRAEFQALADQLGFGRDDRRLISLCLSCYDEVRCRKDPEDWLRRALAAYETVTPLEQSPWGAYWMQELESALSFAEGCLQKAGKRIGRDEILAAKYGPLFEKNLLQVQKLMQETTWDGVFENRISDFGRLPVVRSCEDEESKLCAQKLRKDALEAIRSAQRAFYAQAQQVEADLQKTRLPSRVLCSCCVRSTRRLQRKSGGESFWTFPIWSMRRLRFCTGRTEASARARGRLPRSTARFWLTSTRIPTRCRSASLRRCQRAGKTVFWSAT